MTEEIKKYNNWIENPYFDDKTKEELKKLNEDEIKDRFYKDLEFGTGGLRGVLGAGTNRMNIYTVRKATQGLANYISKNESTKSVAIAYDSRNMSNEFAIETAACLNANGIKTFLFDSLRPTPELSFAIRQLQCVAGVVITASHNPAEYNGYKVYWSDGGQITSPLDKEIIKEVNLVTNCNMVKTMDVNISKEQGLFNIIGKEIDDLYIEKVKEQALNPEIISGNSDIKIVYTPLHGTGNILVRRVLDELGFKNVYVVKEQELPDGDFKTVKSPNPEDKNAFLLALKLANEVNADIVLATDPDADRLGIYVLDRKSNKYKAFSGNMLGVLLAEYVLYSKKIKGILPLNGVVVKSIVSTNMINSIAKEYNVELMEVLTGFKYVGELINRFEKDMDKEFVFGMEESYGCLLGTYTRDKDAIVTVMALCDMASYYKSTNMTLWDVMIGLYEKYGYYLETQKSITLKGEFGEKKIKEMVENIRNNPISQLAGLNVLRVRDYKKNQIINMVNGSVSETGLPMSNVIYYELENDSWFAIRPSGTEPKVKIYVGVSGKTYEEADENLEDLVKELLNVRIIV